MSSGDIPPTHKINLSLPPAARYAHLATSYRHELRSITSLFDDLVLSILPPIYLPPIKFLARLLLRRVYDNEETEEIRGIAEVTGIEMYLIVALNVLLDLLMGCTSGAALHQESTRKRDEGDSGTRMLHFRTLDWDMPALRKLLVKLEFVRSPDEETVLATSITYVGFVGVLTGVRKGLSVSLNFRPNHDGSSWVKNLRYYGSHLLVLLGLRRSISSVLRELVIPSDEQRKRGWFRQLFPRALQGPAAGHRLSLSNAVSRLRKTPSTACYLILCDGRGVYVLEKDYKSTTVESSSSFLVATNSDRGAEIPRETDHSTRQEHTGVSLVTAGETAILDDFIKDSIERRECMQAHWNMKVARERQAVRRAAQQRRDPLRRTRSSRRQDTVASPSDNPSVDTPSEPEVTATLDEIVTWTTRYPTTNEMTHFATVMDPTNGTVAWIRRYPEPLDCDWEQDDFE